MTTVAAKDVQVGDKIFNNLTAHPLFQWLTVTAVRLVLDGTRVVISTASWDAWKHPEESVSVRRVDITDDPEYTDPNG